MRQQSQNLIARTMTITTMTVTTTITTTLSMSTTMTKGTKTTLATKITLMTTTTAATTTRLELDQGSANTITNNKTIQMETLLLFVIVIVCWLLLFPSCLDIVIVIVIVVVCYCSCLLLVGRTLWTRLISLQTWADSNAQAFSDTNSNNKQ